MRTCATVWFTRMGKRGMPPTLSKTLPLLAMVNLSMWAVAFLLLVGDCSQVKDAIALDAKLVPLYRLMAAECDQAAGLSTTAQHDTMPGSIADAEKVLAEHFGDSTKRGAAPSAQTANGSQMSEDEAEAILAQHFK